MGAREKAVSRRIRVIGIGSGNPDHMTIQAIDALNSCDVLFVPTKGEEKAFLAELRHEICTRFITGPMPRLVHYAVPKRRSDGDYGAAVDDWHDAIAAIYEDLLLSEVAEGETVGLLVWGDPMLYDSTLRLIDRLKARARVAFDYDVIPGITSLQVLCAEHRMPLNRIGAPVTITTGRRLADGWPEGASDVAVMLDGVQAFNTVADPDATLTWGAYLGTPMQILRQGRLGDIADEVTATRAAARAEHGWIMDIYLIRASATEAASDGEAA